MFKYIFLITNISSLVVELIFSLKQTSNYHYYMLSGNKNAKNVSSSVALHFQRQP